MKTLTIASLAGGQGKTATCYFVAKLLARTAPVLAIDADPQASLSFFLGHEVEKQQPTLLEVLKKTVEIHDGIYEIENNLFLIPADGGLNQAQEYLSGSGAGALVLRRRLREARDLFGYCTIDPPPQESQICLSAIAAADKILIPIELTVKGVNSLAVTLDAIDRLRDIVEWSGEILGVVPFRDRWFGYNQSRESREALDAAKQLDQTLNFFPSIRESEQIKKALRFGKPLNEDLGYPFIKIVEALENG